MLASELTVDLRGGVLYISLVSLTASDLFESDLLFNHRLEILEIVDRAGARTLWCAYALA